MKWITALDLDQWADTLAARVDFPGMVGDLIRASVANISDFRFPSGDKGQVRGFDAVLDAESNYPFIPDGESVWEFGVTEGGGRRRQTVTTKSARTRSTKWCESLRRSCSLRRELGTAAQARSARTGSKRSAGSTSGRTSCTSTAQCSKSG